MQKGLQDTRQDADNNPVGNVVGAKKAKNPKPYNNGQWTEARMAQHLRSIIRKATLRWAPRQEAFNRARRPYTGPNKWQRYEWQCAQCKEWFKRNDVQADHIIPCGSLIRPFADLNDFARRALCEVDGWQILCKVNCHRKKTNKANTERKPTRSNEVVSSQKATG